MLDVSEEENYFTFEEVQRAVEGENFDDPTYLQEKLSKDPESRDDYSHNLREIVKNCKTDDPCEKLYLANLLRDEGVREKASEIYEDLLEDEDLDPEMRFKVNYNLMKI